jgi:rod shape-determining protein MreC
MRLPLFNIEDARDYIITGFILLTALFLMLSRNADGVTSLRRLSITAYSFLEEPLANVRVYRQALTTNEQLQRKNIQLQDELNRLRSVQAENEAYKGMLALEDTSHIPLLPVRIIGKNLTGINNSLTINAGSNDGIEAGMAVINAEGLVGRVVLSSSTYSEVMPLINGLFRVSARIQGTRAYGLISWDGENLDELKMSYVPKTIRVDSGQVVESSGYSLELPPYIPIGTVLKTEFQEGKETQIVYVKPAVALFRIAEAFVVLTSKDSSLVALSKASLLNERKK